MRFFEARPLLHEIVWPSKKRKRLSLKRGVASTLETTRLIVIWLSLGSHMTISPFLRY